MHIFMRRLSFKCSQNIAFDNNAELNELFRVGVENETNNVLFE